MTTQIKEKKSLLRSSAIVSTMTMLSRVLGLIRDVIFARFIGADGNADAFFVAFKVPNFLRRLFAEGAFSQAFVPVLSEYRQNGTLAATQAFIDRICGCLGLSLIGLTVLVVVASPVFTAFFGLGFLINDPNKFWLTADLLRITFPYLLLISMTGFAGAILNSYDQFAVPAITPVFLNVSLIFAAAIASQWFDEPVMALAWGVLAAGVVQLLFQVPFLLRLGLMPHPKVDWSDESVRKVLKLMAPAMFGVSVSQINLLFDTILASFLPTGSPSWLYFSDRLVELPLGVFGVAIATVILPNLSRQFASGAEHFSRTLEWSIQMILLIALPATVALSILAEPILFTLFQYDKMTVRDVTMASYSLRAYALGLTAFMLIKVLASAFFSRQDMKTPVRIGIIAMATNMVLNVIFVVPLHFIWAIGHVGLALATAGSAFLNAGLLFHGLKKDKVFEAKAPWAKFSIQCLVANGVMGLTLVVILSLPLFIGQIPAHESFSVAASIANLNIVDFAHLDWWQRSVHLGVCVMAGGFAYLLTLYLAGLRLKDIKFRAA